MATGRDDGREANAIDRSTQRFIACVRWGCGIVLTPVVLLWPGPDTMSFDGAA